ncbi:MAG: flippase-like domain-containing protein [Synechococcales cyanobacterium CRU_2_2]|nr:flippase-like domain-containing protein [Synechococcales cyanobacterium CRU_2_2]
MNRAPASDAGEGHHAEKTLNGRKMLSWVIATGFTLGLLYWSLRDLSLVALGQTLSQIQPLWLLVGFVAYLGVFGLRAWRWGLLLAADGWPGRFRDRFDAFFIGYAANSILPASAGEVVRAVLLNRLAQVPTQTALGSVLGEKLMDVLVVFVLLAMALARQPRLAEQLPLGLMAGAIGAMVGVFWILARYPQPVVAGVGRLLAGVRLGRWRSPAEQALLGILAGLSIYRQPRRFLGALGASTLAWLLNGITYWAVLMALGITAPGWLGAIAAQSLTAFAIALPSSPGFVGPFEAAVRLGLGLYGVGVTEAIAAALVLRLLMYGITPLVGLAIALRLGLSRADLQGKS